MCNSENGPPTLRKVDCPDCEESMEWQDGDFPGFYCVNELCWFFAMELADIVAELDRERTLERGFPT